MTDDARRTAIRRYVRRHPDDQLAATLLGPDPHALRVDAVYAWVQWRDAVDDFVEERKIRTLGKEAA
jgi:hypothetical protein